MSYAPYSLHGGSGGYGGGGGGGGGGGPLAAAYGDEEELRVLDLREGGVRGPSPRSAQKHTSPSMRSSADRFAEKPPTPSEMYLGKRHTPVTPDSISSLRSSKEFPVMVLSSSRPTGAPVPRSRASVESETAAAFSGSSAHGPVIPGFRPPTLNASLPSSAPSWDSAWSDVDRGMGHAASNLSILESFARLESQLDNAHAVQIAKARGRAPPSPMRVKEAAVVAISSSGPPSAAAAAAAASMGAGGSSSSYSTSAAALASSSASRPGITRSTSACDDYTAISSSLNAVPRKNYIDAHKMFSEVDEHYVHHYIYIYI